MSHAAVVLMHGDSQPPPSSCPACGRRVDPSNVRCPRCRFWLTPPPAPPRWKRTAKIWAACALVLGSLIAGVFLQWLFAPLPWGVVVTDVPDAPDADDVAVRAR